MADVRCRFDSLPPLVYASIGSCLIGSEVSRLAACSHALYTAGGWLWEGLLTCRGLAAPADAAGTATCAGEPALAPYIRAYGAARDDDIVGYSPDMPAGVGGLAWDKDPRRWAHRADPSASHNHVMHLVAVCWLELWGRCAYTPRRRIVVMRVKLSFAASQLWGAIPWELIVNNQVVAGGDHTDFAQAYSRSGRGHGDRDWMWVRLGRVPRVPSIPATGLVSVHGLHPDTGSWKSGLTLDCITAISDDLWDDLARAGGGDADGRAHATHWVLEPAGWGDRLVAGVHASWARYERWHQVATYGMEAYDAGHGAGSGGAVAGAGGVGWR